MKRMVLMLISLFILSVLCTYTPQTTAQATAQTMIFEDDFESYDVGTFPHPPWDLWFEGQGSQYQEIVYTASVSGNKSLKLLGANGWGAVAAKSITVRTDQIGYEVMVRVENWGIPGENGAEVGFVYKMSVTRWIGWAKVTFSSDGYIWSMGTLLQPYSLSTWYEISVIFDVPSNTHTVRIDGELKATNINNNPSDPSRIEAFGLVSNHAEQVCYFDDVKIFEIPLELSTMVYFNLNPNPASVGENLTLRGILVDEFYQPLSDETVKLYARPIAGSWRYIASMTTNEYGIFTWQAKIPGIPAGEYVFAVYYPGSTTYKSCYDFAILIVK